MQVRIESLEFNAILGILDFERVTPQKVIIDLTMEYDYKENFLDYALVSSFVKSYVIEQKFHLIEELLSALSQELKKKFPLIQELSICVAKPSIMPDCRVSVAEHYSF